MGPFPKGIPVGHVVKITHESDNIQQVISVRPWVDYHGLEEAAVLLRNDPHLDTIMGVASNKWMERALQR